MTDTSSILSLPFIQASQAQKHVTHNEALRMLDILVQLAVLSSSELDPPTGAVDGDRYIVPVSATGDWMGKENSIACMQDGVWQFISPLTGWRADVADTEEQVRFDGSQWVPTSVETSNLDLVGVNTTADNTNKLAVSSDATLLTHDGGSHQLKINKAGLSDTAAMLFQSNWSGRAEFGLAGDDNFRIKTSADGTNWANAITVNGAGDVGIKKSPSATLDVDGIMRLSPTLIANLPSANTVGAGGIAFVSDAAGGAQLAFSDGTNWLKVSDGSSI